MQRLRLAKTSIIKLKEFSFQVLTLLLKKFIGQAMGIANNRNITLILAFEIQCEFSHIFHHRLIKSIEKGRSMI
jgi:hypothetical protein